MGRSHFTVLPLPSCACTAFLLSSLPVNTRPGLILTESILRAGIHPGNATQHNMFSKTEPKCWHTPRTLRHNQKMHITEQTQKEHPDKEDTSTTAQEWTAQLHKDWCCAGWWGQLSCFKTHIQIATLIRHREKTLCIPYSDPSLYLTLSPFPRRQIFVLSQEGGHSEM